MFAMARHKTSGSVNYAKPPPNLDFLMLLSEFSHRLLMVDRCGERGVLPFLMKQLPQGQFQQIQEGKMKGWAPLLAYFKVTNPNKGGGATAVGPKGRKRGTRGEGCTALRQGQLKSYDRMCLVATPTNFPLQWNL